MIRVTIELVPGGIGEPRLMHVIEIWNKLGTTLATPDWGDYGYRISRKLARKPGAPSWHKTGDVTRFHRSRKNAVHLLLAVLKDALDPTGEVVKFSEDPDRCPRCGHRGHDSLGFCPNLASDNDCDCPTPVT